jgi:hypothetical protein
VPDQRLPPSNPYSPTSRSYRLAKANTNNQHLQSKVVRATLLNIIIKASLNLIIPTKPAIYGQYWARIWWQTRRAAFGWLGSVFAATSPPSALLNLEGPKRVPLNYIDLRLPTHSSRRPSLCKTQTPTPTPTMSSSFPEIFGSYQCQLNLVTMTLCFSIHDAMNITLAN